MLESFSEMPLAIRFFLAFLVVLGMFGVFAWAVRRFGTGRLGGAGARGRQPRLAVIDHASVDARRRLILVRRDNVEHLIMIGGPTDVVVESTIVRGAPAPREATLPRPALPEALPRALPLPDNSSVNGAWPLQPEAIAPPRQAPRIEAMSEEPAAPPHAEPPPRPQQRETLAALADEIATRPVPPAPRGRPGGAARSRPAEPRAEPRMPAGRPAEAEPAANADQSLADMAQRLEAALRKPKNAAAPPGAARSAPPPAQAADAEAAAPQPAAPPRAAPAPGKSGQSKTLYDSLEQEMASLLGRPAGKT